VFGSATNNQIQRFETEFIIINHPNEFLTGWFGNEIRATSSRIYQANGFGRNGSRALAVQPISTFDGEIIIRLSPSEFSDPQVQFWARSMKNGTGNRAAQVYFSWSNSLEGEYSSAELLGGEAEFANEDQDFRNFELDMPDRFSGDVEIYLKLVIKYGAGSGSCAKWLMDDFEFGEFVVDKIPPKITKVRGYDEKQIEIQLDEAVDPVFSEFAFNYSLNEIEPSFVNRKLDSLVYLSFDEKLEHGKRYELMVSKVPDLEGNFLKDTVISFQFFDPTFIPSKTLVINELCLLRKQILTCRMWSLWKFFMQANILLGLKGCHFLTQDLLWFCWRHGFSQVSFFFLLRKIKLQN
jgi:hypothetical protein